MRGQRINQAAYYRCRFPAEYALANEISHPRNVYVRQVLERGRDRAGGPVDPAGPGLGIWRSDDG